MNPHGPEVLWRVALQVKRGALVRREPREQLVKDVVVPLRGRGSHHTRLLQEVAVDLGAVQRAVCHLHLDEVTL